MAGLRQSGVVRIIAGQWRRRLLHFPNQHGLRPTHDRLRETVFNWLMAEIVDSRCLDGFAGSGAFGFEALSRGAAHVVMVENNRLVYDALQQNATALQTHDCELLWGDFLSSVTRLSGRQFDIVFLDPPYDAGLLQPAIDALEQSGCLADKALIYIEQRRSESVVMPDSWQIWRKQKTKNLNYALYRSNK